MQTVTIIVGVIGSGKTTLARKITDTRTTYISFDQEWHSNEQRKRHSPEEAIEHFTKLCTIQEDTIIDGWWTWYEEWWKITDDKTLFQLRSGMSLFDVRLIHLCPTIEQATTQYLKKHEAGTYSPGTFLANKEAYIHSLPARMDYLSQKVSEWEK